MPESRHRNWKPEAMPALTMFSEALRTKNQTRATRTTAPAACQRMSRTLRSRRKVIMAGSAALQSRSWDVARRWKSGSGEPRSRQSLESRREQQAALGPQFVGAALQLQRRAHADGAFVALAIVPDLLDDIVGPVVAEAHHVAELALDAQDAADLSVGRLSLHLVDVLGGDAERLRGDLRVQHPAHDQLPALVAPARHRPLRIVGDDLGQDLVLGRILELDALAGERADAGGISVAAALVVGRDRVVVLLEVDDRNLEVALAEPVGRGLLLGRAGGDADRGVGEVRDLAHLGLGAHHEGLALVEVDALE